MKITPYFSPKNGGLVTLFNSTSKALYNCILRPKRSQFKVQILWEGPKFFKKSLISFWNASTYLVVTSTQSGRFWKKIWHSQNIWTLITTIHLVFLRHAKGTEKDFDSICLHAPKDTWVVNTGGRILQQNCAVVQAKHNDRSLTHSWDPNHQNIWWFSF